LETGEAIDGPGDNDLTWTIEVVEESTVAPPRSVVRLFPKADEVDVRETLADIHRPQA
jgi:hypothetical protein